MVAAFPKPAGWLARWVLTLQRYDFTTEHKKGVYNKVADALSRAPLPEPPVQEMPDLVAAVDTDSRRGTLVCRHDQRKAQREDGLCQRVIENPGNDSVAHTATGGEFDSYVLAEDRLLLWYIPQTDEDSGNSVLWY